MIRPHRDLKERNTDLSASIYTGVRLSDGHLTRMGQYRVTDHPYHAPQFIRIVLM